MSYVDYVIFFQKRTYPIFKHESLGPRRVQDITFMILFMLAHDNCAAIWLYLLFFTLLALYFRVQLKIITSKTALSHIRTAHIFIYCISSQGRLVTFGPRWLRPYLKSTQPVSYQRQRSISVWQRRVYVRSKTEQNRNSAVQALKQNKIV